MTMIKSALDFYLDKLVRRHARWEVLEGTMKGLTAFLIGVLLVWGLLYVFVQVLLPAR